MKKALTSHAKKKVLDTKDYLGKTGCGMIERTADHAGKDKQSHLLKHAYHEIIDILI